MLRIRLFHPFPAEQLLAALPPTVRAIAVLDRTKEPGAVGEPLYLETVAALNEAMDGDTPPFAVTAAGHRRTLRAVVEGDDALDDQADLRGARRPRGRSATSPSASTTTSPTSACRSTSRSACERPAGEVQAVFFGLGSDGTVGANKASIKIIGESTDLYAQGYYVLDSKKSGSVTVSHLRFGPEPIRSTYLIEEADFVACHQFGLLGQMKVLEIAKQGATFLLNAPYGPDEVWEHLPGWRPAAAGRQGDRLLGDRRARRRRRGRHGQPDQHGHAAVLLPARRDPARRRGDQRRSRASSRRPTPSAARPSSPATSRRSTARSSASPTSRSAAGPTTSRPSRPCPTDVPDFVGPVHLPADGRRRRPAAGQRHVGRRHVPVRHHPVREARDRPDDPGLGPVDLHRLRQVRHGLPARHDPDEGLPGVRGRRRRRPTSSTRSSSRATCRTIGSPSRSPRTTAPAAACASTSARPRARRTSATRRSTWSRSREHRDVERERWDFFQSIPPLDRSLIAARHDQGAAQVLEPLFEFSGACGGCGETPYLRLVSQLFGDRMIVANATGCSSIYGANLPTTPWTVNAAGRGPAWNNSLFEDNAEFGLGMRLALDAQTDQARRLLEQLSPGDRRGGRPRAARRQPGDRARDRCASASGSIALRATLDRHRRAACVRRAAPPGARRRPRPQGRLDHRRRRLGLRHRLRRPRPGPRLRSQRQHPRPRHRGLLEHRRPGLQGHAARRGRQVRGGRQGDPARRTSARSPAPTATSTSPRSRWARTTSRRPRRCSRPTPGRGRRWSSPTAPASRTAST